MNTSSLPSGLPRCQSWNIGAKRPRLQSVGGVARRRRGAALVTALVLGSVGGLVLPLWAQPHQPLDFPSLGTVTLGSGLYAIDTTGTVPLLVGPGTHLSGTISASGVAVFRFDDLTVRAGAILDAARGTGGKAARPFALLASGDLTFAGSLNASGAWGGNGTLSAGGVGGDGKFGGDRGTRARASKSGEFGGSVSDVEPSVRLTGGGGGHAGLGRGSGSGSGGGGGGGGGGAVEFGARGTVNLTGSTIDVSGGNGGAGGGEVGLDAGRTDLGGGGGGGGGGAVLLHGATVTLRGDIKAHGGNGGKGRGFGMGGAGGRVSIQADAKPDTNVISVMGGFSASILTGANGGIVFAQRTITPTSATISGSDLTPPDSATRLSRELSDGSARVRERAVTELSELGYEAIPSVPALSTALRDEEASVRSAAAVAVATIGPEAAAAVPNLILHLKDQDPVIRHRALLALSSIGPAAKDAVAALQEPLKDGELDNSARAADTLGRIGEPAIAVLIEALSHRDARTRGRAVLGLRALGSKAIEAIPALVAALQGPYGPDTWVQNYATWTLGEMGAAAKEALPALRQSLMESRDALLFQFNAAQAMLLIDPSAEVAVEVLKRNDLMPVVSPLDAAAALALVPGEADAALPILMKRLEAGEYPDNSQINVIRGVGRLGPKFGAPALPRLEAIARNAQELNRLAAAEALLKLTGEPDELLAAIGQELANPSSARRAAALKALARLGPQGQQLAERTIPLLKDNDWPVREAARNALKQIDPDRAKALKIPH